MYHPNNIEFRVASAAAIGEFKTAQAHTFLQVCRKEFEFGMSAREVVLLSYSRFSEWLFAVEREFLQEERARPSVELIEKVINLFQNELKQIEKTCEDNPTIFSNEVVVFLKCIHSYAISDMKSVFHQLGDNRSSKAFIAFSEAITDYLQHVLLAMHEYNNNLVRRNAPFICIGRYSLLSNEASFNSIKQRARFFRAYLNPNQTFIVKNYTDENLSDQVVSILDEFGIRAHVEIAA